MDGRDLTFDDAGECAGGTWPASAGVRRVQAPGNTSEFLTQDTTACSGACVLARGVWRGEQRGDLAAEYVTQGQNGHAVAAGIAG